MASLVAVLLWVRWGGIRKGIWIDLDVYIRGASAVLHHEPLYGVSVHGQPFTYPPFAALVFIPFDLLGSVGARWVLTAASIGCYLLLVVICALAPTNYQVYRLAPFTAPWTRICPRDLNFVAQPPLASPKR